MKWIRKSALEPLAVSMSGLKLGDRLLVIGCSDPMLIAGLASKVGLTGRACAVDENQARATEAGRVAESEGALIETAAAPDWQLPYDEGAFDVVVVRAMLSGTTTDSRSSALREARRVLRPGGRCVAIEGATRRGLSSLMGGQTAMPNADEATGALVSAGFVAVRTLAARDGLLFVEGVRKNL